MASGVLSATSGPGDASAARLTSNQVCNGSLACSSPNFAWTVVWRVAKGTLSVYPLSFRCPHAWQRAVSCQFPLTLECVVAYATMNQLEACSTCFSCDSQIFLLIVEMSIFDIRVLLRRSTERPACLREYHVTYIAGFYDIEPSPVVELFSFSRSFFKA
jgi:hypothetical protein